jgi:hypothetical protein
MLAQFQSLYPNGGVISELLQIFQGKFIVRVSLQVEGVTRATGMAGADTIEAAEDEARNRALMALGVGNTEAKTPLIQPVANKTNVYDSLPSSGDGVTSPPPVFAQNSKTEIQNHHQVASPNFTETTIKEEPIETSPPKLEMVSSPEPEPEPQTLPEITPSQSSNVTPFSPRSYSPAENTGFNSGIGKKTKKSEPVNLSDVIAQTDVQIERLGWTKEQGREHLKKTYGKLGRSLLSEEELLDFLDYLKSQPDPIAGF